MFKLIKLYFIQRKQRKMECIYKIGYMCDDLEKSVKLYNNRVVFCTRLNMKIKSDVILFNYTTKLFSLFPHLKYRLFRYMRSK